MILEKNLFRGLICYLFFLVLTSFFSLPISPLPWFDEVVFSNIAENFSLGKGFEFSAAPPYLNPDRQIYTYGPIYFVVASIPYLFLDVSEWVIRLNSLLMGGACLFLIFNLAPSTNRKLKLILVLLILSDVIFTSNSHGGRMDLMSIAFWLTGLLIHIRGNLHPKWRDWCVGLLFALGYLTTPRSFIIFGNLALIIPLYIFLENGIRKASFSSIKMAVSFSALILGWIYWAFGSINAYQEHFAILSKTFIGGTPLPPVFQWPLIAVVVLLFIYGLLFKRELLFSSFKSPIVPFSIASILSFYFLVHDTGTYSIFIILLYYSLLIVLSHLLLSHKFRNLLLLLFLLGNATVIILKYTVVFSGDRWAKKEHMELFISNNVPSGSRLVGDEIYYYGCRKNEINFQFIDHYLSIEEREQYQREVFNYDYLFVSDRLKKKYPDIIDIYEENSTLSAIDTLNYNTISSDFILLEVLRKQVHNSFNGVLYKRNR